jgi:hypothetical protein
MVNNERAVSGFITFIHIDEKGKPVPHGIVITVKEPEDIELQTQAKALPR